ncbi:sulfotransferase [Hyphobacterium sp. HN65]|uniref:Sulfotransferase n=1 Tax=Hyphobacterium lacteum TaxID=3116575 RepID=A0ABU7LPE4_9PROT|nr:sulfotransferase [Hyphobacterium sp. HN65]MEE2525474.1 sulfotransferase [Hyphobacterium sp. HN65]
MNTDQRLTGVMICGAGHSGSTLLGLILGRAANAFYMGEGGKVRYLHDLKKPLRKRACKVCGEDCPVWSGFHWDETQPLYRQVADHVGASTIVDSTKNPGWIKARTAELDAQGDKAVLIFLQRDGRAVLNSRFRKYPDKDAAEQIEAWKGQIAASRDVFDAFHGEKIEVRYEQLATSPEAVIHSICELAGLPFDPAMLDFTRGESHPLGGNTGTQFVAARDKVEDDPDAILKLTPRTESYYAEHSGDIRLDLRWKTEMPASKLALFNELAGEFNAAMAWGE